MKRKTLFLSCFFSLLLLLVISIPTFAKAESVVYQAHVQDIGWMNPVADGQDAGTTGQNKQVEAVKIHLEGAPEGSSIHYSTHVQNIGWQPYTNNGQEEGTTGKALQVEAIKINVTGPISQTHDVYYRTHVQDYGWLGWAKNDEVSGTSGYNKQVEALDIMLIPKGSPAPGTTELPGIEKSNLPGSIAYTAHVENIGWQDKVRNGGLAGTEGQGLKLEAFTATMEGISPTLGFVSYRAHVSNIGWQDFVAQENIAGTTGQNRAVEAFEILLNGAPKFMYDIYYRAHVQDIGWMGWAENGQSAGTQGAGKRVEAMEVVLVPKGNPAPGVITDHFRNYNVQKGIPGVRSVENFLRTALMPVGKTLYVWGGGWNEPDNAAGPGATTIGLYPNWVPFFNSNNAYYNYLDHKYEILNGLDCSGYVGWTVYNTLNTVNGGFGEVYWADEQARWYAGRGMGNLTPLGQVNSFQPGDIISMPNNGHVYIVLGTCSDGSVLVVHSSPPGVMISGIANSNGTGNQATRLAHEYMQKYYPEYFNRYSGQINRQHVYLEDAEKFSWGDNFVGDHTGIRNHNAEEVLKILFNEN